MNIDNYIDAALGAGPFPSERQLSLFLGFGPAAINNYRTKRAWPSDDTMIRLAELAGADPEQALLDLNLWRSTGSPKVASVYRRIAKRLERHLEVHLQALVLVGSLLAIGAIAPANAARTTQPSVSPSYTLCDLPAPAPPHSSPNLNRQ